MSQSIENLKRTLLKTIGATSKLSADQKRNQEHIIKLEERISEQDQNQEWLKKHIAQLEGEVQQLRAAAPDASMGIKKESNHAPVGSSKRGRVIKVGYTINDI